MLSNPIKEDKRVIRTQKLLDAAMRSLLRRRNFKVLSVEDICDEATVGRATFYTHFSDKYDLLRWWLEKFWPDALKRFDSYEIMQQKINDFTRENRAVIQNIIQEADGITLSVVHKSLLVFMLPTPAQSEDGTMNPKYVVLSNFYVGGLVNYLVWQVSNNFSTDIEVMNVHLYKIMSKLWEYLAEET